MEFNEILRHFRNVKQEGGSQWRADCPACGDTKRHLYIMQAPDKILFDCKKGCSFNDIISAAGLTAADCFTEHNTKFQNRKRELIREHFYTDMQGGIIAKKQIYDTVDGKQAVWYRLEKGQYIKGLGGAKMPLYHLHRLIKAGRTVVVAEGEKDVETLERLGYTATTSPNGAGAKWRGEWSEFFRGKNAAVITDNDEAGEKYGICAAEVISKTAAAVKMIPASEIYPNVKPKGDISDIAAELGDAETRRLLSEAVKKAPVYSPAAVCGQSIVIPEIREDEPLIEKIAKLKPQSFTYNDRGNSELFSRLFGKTVRYNVTAKEWYIYKNGFWQEDTGGMEVNRLAAQLYDALIKYASNITDGGKTDYIAHVNKLGRLNVREAMIKDARSRDFIKTSEFDRDPWLFNCKNGTYDLKNEIFRSHSPDDLLSKMSNVVYDGKAESPEFMKYLLEVMSGDREKMRYLLTALGYALTGDTSAECMFILYGSSARNGKGTLMETISYMMGGEQGYAKTAMPETFVQQINRDSRQASGDIARLAGARFLNVSEPKKNMVLDSALIKTLTGRDTITARHLHEREFQFIPEFKLFINTNYLPLITDSTLFSSDRINVITFDEHYEGSNKDTSLKDKFRTQENISGIFNICLAGLDEYRKRGLIRPQCVISAINDYRNSNDRMGIFIAECFTKSSNSNITAKDAYEVYRKWCSENNYHAENKSNFISGMRARNMVTDRVYINGKDYRSVIKGYKISAEYYSDDTPF